MNHGNFKHLYLYCSIFSQLPFILQGRRHAKAEKNTWIKWEPWHLLKWPRTCNLRGKNIGRRLFCCSICHTVTVGSLCFVFQFLQWKLQLITYSGIIKKKISWIIHQYKKIGWTRNAKLCSEKKRVLIKKSCSDLSLFQICSNYE